MLEHPPAEVTTTLERGHMTITDDTAHASGLRDLTDEDLAGVYQAADDLTRAAALREAGRRDREDTLAKSRRKLDEILAEGYDAAYAQYLKASEWTRGSLLSDLGRTRVTDEMSLWTGSEATALRYASEELRDFWMFVEPRITPGRYARQRGTQARIDREQARDEREARNGHDPELARPEAGALRHEPATAQAPQAGPGRPVLRSGPPASHDASTGQERDGRPAGPVQRDGTRMSECRHPRTRFGTDRQCSDCPAAGSGTVAVPVAAPAVARAEQQIPGDQLLDLLRDSWFGAFARFPSVAALDAVTLWAAHCWMRDENGVLVFRATPRLGLFSSEPGSGKGRVLELLAQVVPNCFGLDLEPTKAGLVHTLNKERATVLLDEGDLLFSQGQRHSDVRAVINGGTYRHGTVLNGKGAKANREPVFGPLALAGLDTLETATGDRLTALLTRFVKIYMEKASGDDRPPKLTRKAEDAAGQAKVWLERWAAQVRDEVADAEPEIPEGVEGRAEDIWTPLLAVADAAGGEWPDRARAACRELALALPEGGEDTAAEFAAFADSFGAFR